MKNQQHKIPVMFYLRKQILGGKRAGKTDTLYVYKNFRGSIQGVVRASNTRGAQKQIRELYPDSEFFRNK